MFFLDIWCVLKNGWSVLREKKTWVIAFVFHCLALAVIFLPVDEASLKALLATETPLIHQLARSISYWGDFLTGSLILAGVVFLGGVMLKNHKLRQAALASLLAAALAGVATNCFRLTLGRPRPHAVDEGIEHRLHGLKLGSKFHGFPSGHSATAMGSTTALAVIYPPAAIPVLILGSSVGYSRMMLNRHYPSDVIMGSCLGITAGFLLGCGVRRRFEIDVKK